MELVYIIGSSIECVDMQTFVQKTRAFQIYKCTHTNWYYDLQKGKKEKIWEKKFCESSYSKARLRIYIFHLILLEFLHRMSYIFFFLITYLMKHKMLEISCLQKTRENCQEKNWFFSRCFTITFYRNRI